ncbi:MAG: hypothetical protein Kow00108_25210 [Calditrichia bacterium]
MESANFSHSIKNTPFSDQISKVLSTFAEVSEKTSNGPEPTENSKNVQDKAFFSDLKSVVDTMNESLELINTKIVIQKDTATNKTILRVVNAETGEVIREVPPEALLKISAKIAEYLDKASEEKPTLNRMV